jgi:hypothetical protein
MLTTEQLDNWFTYHLPTDEQIRKYDTIRNTEIKCIMDITQATFENVDIDKLHEVINNSTRCMAEVIDANAPDCADKTAAIRCVRLARMAWNEWAQELYRKESDRRWHDTEGLFVLAEQELIKARWQACAAIACGGK